MPYSVDDRRGAAQPNTYMTLSDRGGGEGVGHETVEVEPLTEHPGVSTALKVDLQERQQLTAHAILHQSGFEHGRTCDLVIGH